MSLPQPFTSEMTVKKQVTITAGDTHTFEIPIPNGTLAGLKGYGYSFYTSTTSQLIADQVAFPSRSDQEGSASIPRIFEQHIPLKSGSSAKLVVTNGDSADHTYDVVFYFYLSQMFPNTATYQSSGGELIIATGGGSGVAQNIVVYDSSVTTAANVTARGMAVDPYVATAILSGSGTAGSAAAAIGTGACRRVTVAVDANATTNIYIGNATSQDFLLLPGQSMTFQCSNLNLIYVKRVTSDTTFRYIGEQN